MQIEIHIPRPGVVLLFAAAVSGWGVAWSQSGTDAPPVSVAAQILEQPSVSDEPAVPVVRDVDDHSANALEDSTSSVSGDTQSNSNDAVGGNDPTPSNGMRAPERRAMQARAQQQLLREKQEVITELLRSLDQERRASVEVHPELERQFKEASTLLASLLRDEKKAEEFILSTYNQIWEAEGRAMALGSPRGGRPSDIVLDWPVEPLLGISAGFLSPEYRDRFHFDHFGVDVPVDQGSEVRAAAGGIVRDVVDHGLGFSYITIEHPGNFVTLYGHLSDLTVAPGDSVTVGDVIGSSGGRPGTPGAGFSTGPHLHFGLYQNGAAIDPAQYFPSF